MQGPRRGLLHVDHRHALAHPAQFRPQAPDLAAQARHGGGGSPQQLCQGLDALAQRHRALQRLAGQAFLALAQQGFGGAIPVRRLLRHALAAALQLALRAQRRHQAAIGGGQFGGQIPHQLVRHQLRVFRLVHRVVRLRHDQPAYAGQQRRHTCLLCFSN